jgi:hypothetical protein
MVPCFKEIAAMEASKVDILGKLLKAVKKPEGNLIEKQATSKNE